MTNLSDIQRILLSAATQRADGSLLPAPDTLTNVGARITKALAALVKHELAEERETNDAARVVRDEGHRLVGVTGEGGEPLIAVHATKGTRRYRYYVSRSLQEATGTTGIRVPARELEAVVTTRVADAFDDPIGLATAAGLMITPAAINGIDDRAASTAAQLRQHHAPTVAMLISAVSISASSIEIECSTAGIAELLGLEREDQTPETLTLIAAVTLTRSGRAVRLVQNNGAAVTVVANPSLIKLLVKARRWWSILKQGEQDIKALAAAEGVQASYVTRVVRLAFLSPAVVQAILAGTIRDGVDAAAMTATDAVPACWQAQGKAMLVASPAVA